MHRAWLPHCQNEPRNRWNCCPLPLVRSEAKITNKWLEAGEWHIGDKGEKHPAKLHLKAKWCKSIFLDIFGGFEWRKTGKKRAVDLTFDLWSSFGPQPAMWRVLFNSLTFFDFRLHLILRTRVWREAMTSRCHLWPLATGSNMVMDNAGQPSLTIYFTISD